MDYIVLLVIFLAGILTKAVDVIVDDNKGNKRIGYLLGIIYGILIGYILTTDVYLASLGIAVVISVILTSKIDHVQHALGIAAMLIVIAVIGMPQVHVVMLIIFLAGGISDEVLSDYSDRKKKYGIFRYRVILKIVTLIVSMSTGNWILFIGMILYDLGYTIIDKVAYKFL